jgi:hypothetical protein
MKLLKGMDCIAQYLPQYNQMPVPGFNGEYKNDQQPVIAVNSIFSALNAADTSRVIYTCIFNRLSFCISWVLPLLLS